MEAGEVVVGGLVVPGSDASSCLEFVDRTLDGVSLRVEAGVMADGPIASGAPLLPVGGLVPLLRDDRLDTASARWARFPRDEYALSPAVASGRVRGRPTGPRTHTFSRTGMNCGLSAAWPAVRVNAGGRYLRSAARRALLVCPSLGRPGRAALSRSLCRRRMCRRSSRAGSLSVSCPLCSSMPPPVIWSSPPRQWPSPGR